MDKEDGEMSDDNFMLVDDEIKRKPEENYDKHTVLFRADKNGVYVEKLEKVDASKLQERAKRFGLNLSGGRAVTQAHIDELYANCGIESGNERHFRFDALHLYGVDGLSTHDIFEYLEDFKPVSLDRIDNNSCNVICQDHIAVALALLVHSREIRDEELKKMLSEKSDHHWREGMPHPDADLILMRFATNGDKKVPKIDKKQDSYKDQNMDSSDKNPWGDLCRSWGVYDHQEVFNYRYPRNNFKNDSEPEEPSQPIKIRNKKLAMRLGKRNHDIQEDSEDSSSDSEWKKRSKTPRMRMHADDEESKKKLKYDVEVKNEVEDEGFAPLSIEVDNSQGSFKPKQYTTLSEKFKRHSKALENTKRDCVRSRLGAKVVPISMSSDENSSDSSDHNVMSRVSKVRSTSSVWSRLENNKNQSRSSAGDLRQMIKSKKRNPDDLRERLGKAKKSNLRIEIDNN